VPVQKLPHSPPFAITPADLESSVNTKICCILDLKSGAREGGSGYDIPNSDGATKLRRCTVDQELSAKIESELQMEKEMRDSEKLPASISDYLDSSTFEVSS